MPVVPTHSTVTKQSNGESACAAPIPDVEQTIQQALANDCDTGQLRLDMEKVLAPGSS